MYKTKEEVIIIQAETKDPIPTRAVFWSHDKGTAKMLFKLRKDGTSQPLTEGTVVPVVLDFNSDTAKNGRGRHIYHAVIEDAVNGIVSIVLEDNILGYQGRVDGSIYIELPDSRSLDTAGRFTFHIKRSPIDEDVPELEDYYWQGFGEIVEQYHESIAEIKLEAKTLLDSLTADVTTAKTKVAQLEQSITTANTNLNARIDEINKKIDDNDVFTKAESSANVIDNIAGAETATLKKELLVNGTESTAQRYIKDIPNLALDDPLYQEYGVVPGQPNLLNGTSSEWQEYTISSGWHSVFYDLVNINDAGLKAGDTVSLRGEVGTSSLVNGSRMYLEFKNELGTVLSGGSTSVIPVGTDGFTTGSWVIPENAATIGVSKVTRGGSELPCTFKYRKAKLIKGALTSMDTWSPHQSESGLTIINNGMVSFTDDEYAKLNDPDGIVRSETNIVGRGAEIETPFKIIEVFANRYPDIFGKTTTDAEKIARFKSIQKGVTIKSTLRGSGANASKNGQLYLKHTDGTSEFLVNNQTSEFVEISKTLTATQLDQLSSTGVLTFYATTKRNGTSDAGATSDGVTSALLEVKDLRLVVEIEANGKTIIKSMIAQNHVENLATTEEAKAGTNTTKTMVPATTAQAIDNRAVTLASNQVIGGIKNFLQTPLVNDVPVATYKDLGEKVARGSGLTTIQSDKQSSFTDFAYEFRRIGNTVYFYARVNVKDATSISTSFVNMISPPAGFSIAAATQTSLSGVPLGVRQWTMPQGAYGGLLILDGSSVVIKFASNKTGNHYMSGSWPTDDKWPS